VKALALAALVGVIHVHHAPSHDSDAPFEAVLSAAGEAGLDFVVLTDHAEASTRGSRPRRTAGRS
jgi:predicted metal-dependent phosphoesterase TrpH